MARRVWVWWSRRITERVGCLEAVSYTHLDVYKRQVQDGAGVQLDLAGKGPGQIDAVVKGRIATGFRSADLAISGTGQAALINAFIGPCLLYTSRCV